ncbi:MAG: hypothetical protein ACI4RP_03350 [Acutalibacteraceae bacterium]
MFGEALLRRVESGEWRVKSGDTVSPQAAPSGYAAELRAKSEEWSFGCRRKRLFELIKIS